MSFKQFSFEKSIELAIAEKGYADPTPVQKRRFLSYLTQDVMVSAQTGTGKTAGFTLPVLQNLCSTRRLGKSPRALVVAPTRELAAQVYSSVCDYGKHLPFKSCVVFGGVKINPQITLLRRGCDILIATPGRLLDLVNQVSYNCLMWRCLYWTSDRMLDMGFIHDIRRILKQAPNVKICCFLQCIQTD